MIHIQPNGRATLHRQDVSTTWLLYYLFSLLEVISPDEMDRFDRIYDEAAQRMEPDVLVRQLIKRADGKKYRRFQKELGRRWKRFRDHYSNKTRVEILDAISFFRTGADA
jgi:hypothetical protein